MKGPRPKPTALKKLAGNPGKRPLNKSEPKPKAKKPYCPPHLNDYAKREWHRIANQLFDLGLLTLLDRAALAMVCQAWGRWVTAEEQIKETGGEILTSDQGNLYQNPWRYEANKAYDQMKAMLSEFGLTPSSRTRLQVDKPEEESLADILFQLKNG